MKKAVILIAATFVATLATYCKHVEQTNETKGVSAPDAEGLGISFVSNLPAMVAHEAIKNLPLLAAASNPDGSADSIRDLPVNVRCENLSDQEARCVMVYEGTELKLDLAAFFFDTMSGTVYARRGCQRLPCTNNPMRLFWRALTYKTQDGKIRHDIDVCRIEGLEAGLGINSKFTYLAKKLERISYKPDINGFRATIEEFQKTAPRYDDYGYAIIDGDGKQSTGPTTDYRVVDAYAGMGPMGPFPTDGCLMTGERGTTPQATASLNSGRLPDAALAAAPGRLVKFMSDATHHVGKASARKDLSLNVRCRNKKASPVCELTYKGPELTVPLPSYITGIFSANLVLLRNCTNPGCVRPTQSEISMTTYMKDGLEILEACSMKGAEMINYKKFPLQDRLVGVPDLTGMVLGVDLNGSEPVLSKFRLGTAGFGNYPTARCAF